MTNTVIIDYGVGNVKSLSFALERLGVHTVLSHDKSQIASADHLILPGVGQAAVAMQALKNYQLDTFIPTLENPILGICLGMQLMSRYTEEGKTTGMNIFEVDFAKFSKAKTPQIGWNSIVELKLDLFKGVGESDMVYFAHSFYTPKNEYTVAITNYSGMYSSALQKNNFYGVQFHPEKSGKVGEKILQNFINIKAIAR